MTVVRGNARGVADWASRDPWRERMGLMMEKHLRKACDLNDLAIEELAEVVGPLAMTALDCAFEDLCATVWEDGTNLAGDYLKRRGWKETAMNRAYIEAHGGLAERRNGQQLEWLWSLVEDAILDGVRRSPRDRRCSPCSAPPWRWSPSRVGRSPWPDGRAPRVGL